MDPYEAAYNKALKFLSFRQRSEKEVRDNLKKKKIEDPLIDRAIEKLKEQKFLNDAEFAHMWVSSRRRSKPTSKRVLKMELRQKGIDEDIIETEITNQKQGDEFDLEMAHKLVTKKIEKMKHLEKREIYQKLGGALSRRGFDWEIIKHVIDDHIK